MSARAPELAKLDYFLGTWCSGGEIKPGGVPSGKLVMTEQNEWMAGGHFLVLRSEFTSPLGSGTGVAFMGYDAVRQLYTYDEFSSTGERQLSTGTLEGNTWKWDGEQNLSGVSTRTRFTMNVLSRCEYRFTLESSVDGENWSLMMEGVATKVA